MQMIEALKEEMKNGAKDRQKLEEINTCLKKSQENQEKQTNR